MIPPLPVFMVTAPPTGTTEPGYDIYLNRSGINSIDLPREEVSVEIGSLVSLRFLNRGSPIHITASSSNASMYTDFFHENMYIVDESVLAIPIRKESREGFFDLDIIAGYGAVKTGLRVHIVPAQRLRPVVKEEFPLQPVAHGRPHLLMVMMGISLILYSTWLYTSLDFLNIAAFLTLIVGALYTWYRQD
ncbi:MAG: hypothetical protein GX651_06685 [Methanomicrobiales archaeon]|nr:hypothetical protein [Methanomicrobiales archaeon]